LPTETIHATDIYKYASQSGYITLIPALGNNLFFFAGGTGIVITFKPKTESVHAGILRVEEGSFVSGNWKPGRRLNGDQVHQGRHLRIPINEYSIQRIKLYQYK
jgi:hypothetical protein